MKKNNNFQEEADYKLQKFNSFMQTNSVRDYYIAEEVMEDYEWKPAKRSIYFWTWQNFMTKIRELTGSKDKPFKI